MVYSYDILNSGFNALAGPPNPPLSQDKVVGIYYNGRAIHAITGPTPHIDLNTTVERNGLGMAQSYNTKITLAGTIVRTGAQSDMTTYGSGVGPVISGITELQNVFRSGDPGVLEIYCKTNNNGNSTIVAWTGCRLVSMNFPQNSNHWIFTSDYTIELEHISPAISGCNVKSIVDSWSMEPIEDYIYSAAKVNVTQKEEYHNPKLKPTAPTSSSPQPRSNQTTNANGATSVAGVDIDIISIPQYKISRTITAVGIPSGTGLDSYTTAWLNAKECVDSRLVHTYSGPANNPSPSGMIVYDAPAGGNISTIIPMLKGNGYLYNYLKTTNFNIYEGSYEITETYLAMPTGIGYSEDYTVDMSTDDKYIGTVRVQGTVKGLSMMSLSAITGSGGAAPSISTGTNNKYANIDLTNGAGLLEGTFGSVPNILDNISQPSHNTKLTKSRYLNAVSGWVNDIKPYLYRRACIAMNSKDRDRAYINPAMVNGPPGNPSYSYQNVLNIIPVNTSETHDPRKGTISYTYEYNNKFTIISGVLFENISMTDTGPTDVIGEAFVLGRSLGPVLQNLGTKTSSRKSMSIEVGVVPPSSLSGFFITSSQCPLYTGGTVYKTIELMIEGFKPFGDRDSSVFGNTIRRADMRGQVYLTEDNQTWDPNNGRYSRNVGWVYQQCDNTKIYLDN
jgi:hypothetical protein